MKLRVQFEKKGAIRYIGHLDVMRFFQKCIRRAEIDVVYTKGFSPHQVMSFASPLSVSLESEAEYMDIEVNSITTCEDIKNRLNESSVPGIYIKDVKVLPENAPNAMASVFAARYKVGLKNPAILNFSVDEAINAYLSQEEISITKVGKAGERTVNIRPGIYELSYDGQDFHMLINASSSGNIKPIHVLSTFFDYMGSALPENALIITRIDLYTNNSAEDLLLVSMNEIGTCM